MFLVICLISVPTENNGISIFHVIEMFIFIDVLCLYYSQLVEHNQIKKRKKTTVRNPFLRPFIEFPVAQSLADYSITISPNAEHLYTPSTRKLYFQFRMSGDET